MANVKDIETILRQQEKKVTYKGNTIRLWTDFSEETLQVRREWQEIIKDLKEKNLQSRIQYPTRLLFKIEGEIVTQTSKN